MSKITKEEVDVLRAKLEQAVDEGLAEEPSCTSGDMVDIIESLRHDIAREDPSRIRSAADDDLLGIMRLACIGAAHTAVQLGDREQAV
jgi:hypothetical protein